MLRDDFILVDRRDIPSAEQIEEEEKERKEQKNIDSCAYLSIRRGLNLGALTFGSVTEIMQFLTGLNDLSSLSHKLLGVIKPDLTMNAVLTSIYGLQAVSINSTFTNEGIDTICRIMRGEKLPEWTELPTQDAIKANIISILINSYGLFSDAAQTVFYFLQEAAARGIELNTGVISAIILISSSASASNIPTESLETHLAIRRLFGKPERPDILEEKKEDQKSVAEKIAHLLSLPIEKVLQFFGALEDMIESYTTIITMLATLWGISNPQVQWLILLLSATNGLIDTMFNGKQTSEALELLKKTILSGEYGLKELSAFVVSLFAATLVGQAQYNLIFDMLTKNVRLPYPLPTQLAEWLCEIMSTGSMARWIVNETYYFYPLVITPLNYFSRITQGPQDILQFDFSYVHGAEDEEWVTIEYDLPEKKEEQVAIEYNLLEKESEDDVVTLESDDIDDSEFVNKKPDAEQPLLTQQNTSIWATLFNKKLYSSTQASAQQRFGHMKGR